MLDFRPYFPLSVLLGYTRIAKHTNSERNVMFHMSASQWNVQVRHI